MALMRQKWFGVVLLLAATATVLGQVATGRDEGDSQSRASATANVPGTAPAIFQIGGDVKAPKLIHQVDPQYSKRAKKKKISGTVKVDLYVDDKGLPQNVHVTQGVGYGLDEQALLAVQGYRFEPATKNGVPVAVELQVQINFLLM